jgi:hypothetical protein
MYISLCTCVDLHDTPAIMHIYLMASTSSGCQVICLRDCLPAMLRHVSQTHNPCCLATCSMDTWMYLTRHLETNEEVMVVAYGPYRLQLAAPAIPVVQVQTKHRRTLLDSTTVECAGGKQQIKPANDIEHASGECENTPGGQQAGSNSYVMRLAWC